MTATTPAHDAVEPAPAATDIEVTHGPPVDELENEATEPATEQPDEASEEGEESRSKYRRRAQTAEAALEIAQTQLTAARRGLAEAAAAKVLYKPEALWAIGTDANGLFDDAGQLDHNALKTLIDQASKDFGLVRRPKPDPSQGTVSDRREASTWGEAFEAARYDRA